MKLKFNIEQIALCPANTGAARALLEAIGATDWTVDHVSARGRVRLFPDVVNEANLHFNYQLGQNNSETPPLELELLNYRSGYNWMEGKENTASHFGMHVTYEELDEWRKLFASHGIDVAQEVVTFDHTNPHIANSRRYHYVIFNTRPIIGIDLKFIVRLAMEDL